MSEQWIDSRTLSAMAMGTVACDHYATAHDAPEGDVSINVNVYVSGDSQQVQRLRGLPWGQCFHWDPERTQGVVIQHGRTSTRQGSLSFLC